MQMVETDHEFDFKNAIVTAHGKSKCARLMYEAWFMVNNAINPNRDLHPAYPVLSDKISRDKSH